MQIVFIFHLSWPDKYFNQPTMLTYVSRETCFPQIIEIHFPSYPRFPLFTTFTGFILFLLLRFFASLPLSFEYLNIYQYFACCKILILSLLSIVRLKITITIWQRYYHRRSLDRLLRFDSICDWNAHSCSEELKYILSFLFFSPCFLLWQRLHNGWKRTS